MLDTLLGVARDAGRRVTLLGLLPIGLLALFVLGLVWGGAPEHTPSVTRFVDHVDGLSTTEVLLLFAALLAVSILSQPLQLSLVRLLEGYWPTDNRLVSALADRRRARHRKSRARLRAAQRRTAADDAAAPDIQARMQAAWQLQKRYPPEPLVMPTALGNALRAAEHRAGRRYGWDTIVAWPRLYPLLPDRLLAILDDLRDQLDVAVRFCVVFLVAAVISFGLLVTHGWWLLVPAAALVLAWLSYRAAVGAALAYGEGLESAFDLHRFDLLAALHLPLPVTSEEERVLAEQVTGFLLEGRRVPFAYEHGAHDARSAQRDPEHVVQPEH
jgi:hypothetical protein